MVGKLEDINIEGNNSRPSVSLNAKTGVLELSGYSILENTAQFYEPIIQWFENYDMCPASHTELHVKFIYFNTSTSKCLLGIFEQLEFLYKGGADVTVVWYSSDEDMEELGVDYQNLVSMPFVFKNLDE